MRRPPRGCSPGRAASTPAWRVNCSTASRFSPTPSSAARMRSTGSCRSRCSRCCSPPTGKPGPPYGTRRMRSRRSSPSRWDWPACGSRGASNPTSCWGTASASTQPRVWQGCSASRTAPGSSPSADGCSAACPRAGGWRRCSPTPNRSRTSSVSTRGCRSPRTTAPTRWCQDPLTTSNTSSTGSPARVSAARLWKRAMPSTPSCWIPYSTSSSRTQHNSSSPRRPSRWCAIAPGPC
nr:hypothetical protein CPGR_04916 [Mycolicibacterium malmesburyense]